MRKAAAAFYLGSTLCLLFDECRSLLRSCCLLVVLLAQLLHALAQLPLRVAQLLQLAMDRSAL